MFQTEHGRHFLNSILQIIRLTLPRRQAHPERKLQRLTNSQSWNVFILLGQIQRLAAMFLVELLMPKASVLQLARYFQRRSVGCRAQKGRAPATRTAEDEKHLAGADQAGKVVQDSLVLGWLYEPERLEEILDEPCCLVRAERVDDGFGEGFDSDEAGVGGGDAEVGEGEWDLFVVFFDGGSVLRARRAGFG